MFLLQQDKNAIEKKAPPLIKKKKEAPPSPLPRFQVHSFCKTLTLRTQVYMFGFMYIDWCLYISKLIFPNFVLT